MYLLALPVFYGGLSFVGLIVAVSDGGSGMGVAQITSLIVSVTGLLGTAYTIYRGVRDDRRSDERSRRRKRPSRRSDD